MTTENKPNLGWPQDQRDIEARERLSDNDARGALTFRKKPVVIEAMQLTSETAQFWRVYHFIGCDVSEWDDEPFRIRIRTLEGEMWATEGDWVIKGVAGEFYPCKPDIFAQTYESTDSALPTGDGLTILRQIIEHDDAWEKESKSSRISAARADQYLADFITLKDRARAILAAGGKK